MTRDDRPNRPDSEITPTPMVDSDRFAEFASASGTSHRPPPPRDDPAAKDDSHDSDDLVIDRSDGHASGSAPPPDENDDLFIVRNMLDDISVGGAPVAGARPFIAPPPPRRPAPAPVDEDEAPAPEPEEPLFSVNWDEELSTNRPAPSRATAPAPAKAPEAPARPKPVRRRPPAPREPEPLFVPMLVAAGGVIVALAATVATSLSIEPFHTWYYLFAWYPFLLCVQVATAWHDRSALSIGARAKTWLPLFAWSVPVWLLFELWNFRLENWYYVGVPQSFMGRRLGVALSFATVLPGLFLLEEAQRVRGAFDSLRLRALTVHDRLLRRCWIAAGVVAFLLLALPSAFFPLLWGVPVLALEPWLYRRGGESLLRDLEAGRAGRIVRLLLAGLACGVFWEVANHLAGGKWIYTVPGLDRLKWFEMPPLGFLGFPPFALCCWCISRALVELGLLPDWERRPAPVTEEPPTITGSTPESGDVAATEPEADAGAAPLAPDLEPAPAPEPAPEPESESANAATPFRLAGRNRAIAIGGAALASVLILQGMDRWTVDSPRARAADVPGIPDGIAEFVRNQRGRDDVLALLRAIDDGDLYVPGRSNELMLEELERSARLVSLRGIGSRNASRLQRAGVRSVEDLATWSRHDLVNALSELDERGWRPRPRRVGVWIDGARRAVNSDQ